MHWLNTIQGRCRWQDRFDVLKYILHHELNRRHRQWIVLANTGIDIDYDVSNNDERRRYGNIIYIQSIYLFVFLINC